MNSNDKNLNEDIEALRKKVYLEDPDLWFKFTDKVNDNVFDEMILFYACKYNFLSIIKHAVDNNLIDLNSESHNKSFKTILSYLIFTSTQSNSKEIGEYLKNLLHKHINVNEGLLKNDTSVEDSNYLPQFLCPSCNLNIFEYGYSISEKVEFKFSPKENKTIETSRFVTDNIICCSCNQVIDNISANDLESICSIKNCNKCGIDLTVNGLIDKSKMDFDNSANKFIPKSTSYHCANCDNEIDEIQKNYFNISF